MQGDSTSPHTERSKKRPDWDQDLEPGNCHYVQSPVELRISEECKKNKSNRNVKQQINHSLHIKLEL